MNWNQFCDINKLSTRYRSCSFLKNEVMEKNLIDFGAKWCLSTEKKSLLLCGPAGTGKTYFTFCLIRLILSRNDHLHAFWIKSKEIDDRILAESKNFTGDSIIDKTKNAGILFIDDFGIDRATERTERDFYEIIDYRWDHKLPTVITCNLNEKEILNFYGSRIYSRLETYLRVYFEGEDLRKTLG